MSNSSRVQAARLFVAASRPYSCLTPRAIVQLNKFQHGSRPPATVLVEAGARSFSSCGHQRREQLSDVAEPRDRGLSGQVLRRWSVSTTPPAYVNPSTYNSANINPLADTSSGNVNSSTYCSANISPLTDASSNINSSTYTLASINPLTYTFETRHNSDGKGHSNDSAHSSNKSSDGNRGPRTEEARRRAGAMAVAAAAVAAVGVCCTRENHDGSDGPLLDIFPRLHAKALKKNPDELQMSGLKLNHRERRFIKFASVEFHGQLYMTPQDFIESVTDSEPRQRLRRRQLTQGDLDKFYQYTPPLRKGTSRMFREIYDKGIMSYTEYLFLLSILTKPQTGFHIAFNMFDTDGNERVDKQEFLVLMELLNGAVHKSLVTWLYEYGKGGADPAKVLQARTATQPVLESIFSTARRERLQRTDSATAEAEVGGMGALDDSLQKKHQVDTTLLVHFFGQKGRQDLKFEDFKMFMENLQTEVLEIEFNEFSKGLPTISELDFAKILLRYTHLQADQYEMYLERLIDKLSEEKGITFPEFKSFCQFLNTLEDFGIAMRMYTLAEQPISQEEFHRAVRICTGHSLSPHIVATVYNIFDDDGDGQLSYKEFIAIMKDRLHRGFKGDEVKASGMAAFRNCLLRAIRN